MIAKIEAYFQETGESGSERKHVFDHLLATVVLSCVNRLVDEQKDGVIYWPFEFCISRESNAGPIDGNDGFYH